MSFKSFLDKLKKINKINLADIMLPGYYFNKTLFKIASAIIIIWCIIAGFIMGFDKNQRVYYKCSEKSISNCENEFYNAEPKNCPDPDFCAIKSFRPGESFGEPPNFFYKYAWDFAAIILIICFAFNHFKYNKGYKLPEVDL